jgi:cytochrome b561
MARVSRCGRPGCTASLALVLFGAIGLHLGITLYHHFVMRDRTLTRMLP